MYTQHYLTLSEPLELENADKEAKYTAIINARNGKLGEGLGFYVSNLYVQQIRNITYVGWVSHSETNEREGRIRGDVGFKKDQT